MPFPRTLLALATALLQSAAVAAQPAAADPFGYLEDREDPRAMEFFRAQGAAAEAQLAQLPGRSRMAARR